MPLTSWPVAGKPRAEMMTENLLTAVSPTASVAVHVTTVVPTGNLLLEAGVQDTVTGAIPPLEVGGRNVAMAPA